MATVIAAGMFTGLVRALGYLERCPSGVRVRLGPEGSGAGAAGLGEGGIGTLALGDSIAVDGVCLTVAELLANGFRADVSEETLHRTTLAQRATTGAAVNLEPALRLSDRLGGHLVSGHIDGLGTVVGIRREAASWRLTIRWNDPAYSRYICGKASVAVDGISLTVAGWASGGGGPDQAEGAFWIAVIPHTWAATSLSYRRVGDGVNLEADLLAKYTERLLQQGALANGSGGGGEGPAQPPISPGWLADNGWS
jgi:riboflavin synthase